MAVPAPSRWSAQPARRSVRYAKPAVEGLETRITPVLNPSAGYNPAAASFVPAVAKVYGYDEIFGKHYQGTGTLIAPQWVLTVYHVVAPLWTEELRIDINGRTYYASERIALPDPEYEIGMIKLTEAVGGVQPVPIWRSALSVGESAILVGYGRTNNGSLVEQKDTGGIRRAGVSQLDERPTSRQNDPSLYRMRFDGAGESFPGRGDSGGPMLVRKSGYYYVAGVVSHAVTGTTWTDSTGDYGAKVGTKLDFIRTDYMAFWIDAVMAGTWQSIGDNYRGAAPGGVFQEQGVRDVTAPVIAAVEGVTTRATGVEGARVDFAIPQVADDYDLAPTVTLSHASGSVFPVGTTRVTVTATDVSGNASTKQFDVVVQPGEPVGVPETYLVNRKEFDVGVADGVLANDTSPLGRALQAAVAQQPGHGALTLNADGSFRYQPAAGFTGTDTFSYKLDDGLFPSVGPVVVTLNVTRPPDAASETYTVRANEPFATTAQTGVLANDRSAYGNPLTAQLVADVAHGRLTLGSDGSFTYVPTTGYSGTDQFTYSARDGSLTSEAQTVTLVVNFPPTGREDAYLATSGRTLQVPASAGVLANDSDADGGTLAVTLASGPQHGSLTLGAAGEFTYTPAAGFVGSDTFTYHLHDGTHVAGPIAVTIAVERPPEAVADAWFVYASDVLTVPASAGLLANDRDPSGRPLTVELLTGPDGGGLTLRPDGSFTYAPNRTANNAGDVTFQYRVGNGRLFSDPVAVTFHVWAMAAIPDQYYFGPAMVLFPNRSKFDGGSVKGNDLIAGTAPAGTLEGMTAVLVNGPDQGKLTLRPDGTFTYSSEGFHGATTFRYQLTGAGKTSEPADVRLVIPPVAPRNDRYSTLDDVLTVPAAQGLLVNDPSGVGNPLQVTAVGTLTQGKLDLNADGSFTWMTPFPGFRGQAKFTYRVTDGTATSVQTAEVTITAGTPVGRADSYVVGGPDGLTTSASAGVLVNDPTGRWVPQAAELLQGPTRGLLHFQSDGSFSYFPFVGFSGSDTFTYRPTDALGPWEPVTVTLTAGPGLGWANLAIADFNGDGTQDQLGRRVGTNDWWVTQGGTSPLTFRWVSHPRNFAYSGVLVGDVTGDGRADLLTRIAATGRWVANLSTGFGFLPLPWASWSRSVAWVDARLGDVNGDGRLDLIGRVPSTGQWWVGISTDLGARGAVWATWERRPWVEVRVADVNGDGRADVVARDVARRVWVVGYSDRRGRFVSRTFRTDPLAGR